MNKTPFEKGYEIGVEIGVEVTALETGTAKVVGMGRPVLRVFLEERFGTLSPNVLRAVEHLPAEQLRSMARAAWKARTLAELRLES
jgi:hypothetical protein